MKHAKQNILHKTRHGAKFMRHLERLHVAKAKRGFLNEVSL